MDRNVAHDKIKICKKAGIRRQYGKRIGFSIGKVAKKFYNTNLLLIHPLSLKLVF